MIARTYPTLYALIGDLFAADLEIGTSDPDGPSSPADSAEWAGEVFDAALETDGSPEKPYRLTVEPGVEDGSFSPGYELHANGYCGVLGANVQAVCSLGRVTIEPSKFYDPSDTELIITAYKREEGQ